MFFETDLLYAEKLSIDDSTRFHQICTQPHILRWMGDWNMVPEQIEALISFFIQGYEINNPEKHPFIMGIWHKADSEFIGICGFGPKDELGGKAEIAYFIDERYSHKGYMSQIFSKAVSFFFKHFEKPYLSALVDKNNLISKRILLKNSFRFFRVYDSDKLLKSHYRLYR